MGIRFSGTYSGFTANVREKIVVTKDTVTLYGKDKESPDFKDKEEIDGRKIIFAD